MRLVGTFDRLEYSLETHFMTAYSMVTVNQSLCLTLLKLEKYSLKTITISTSTSSFAQSTHNTTPSCSQSSHSP
jgi:hypothetical protein